MLDIAKIRADFPILSRTVYDRPLVYLDSAATAQKPLCVIERMDWVAREINANIHRGVHYLSEQATVAYEAARDAVARFINAKAREEVVFTSGATMSINLVAYAWGEMLKKGENIILTELEHHSNIVPWQLLAERKGVEIKVLPFDDTGNLCVEKLPELLDKNTRLIAVTQASNVLGTCPDLKKIIEPAHANNTLVLVDGCQGVVHGGVDVQALGCDFYAFSGHKLYGPTGIGVLWARREILESMPPFMGGGDMVASVAFEGTTYADVPLKFEAGTAHFTGAIGLAEAINYLQKINPHDLAQHEKMLLNRAAEGLRAIKNIALYADISEKLPILPFNIEGVSAYDVGMILDKLGIAVRTGHHCAEPVMRHYGVSGMCRASFAMYNTVEEADALVAGVERANKMLK